MASPSEIEKLERRWLENMKGLTFVPLAEAYRKAGRFDEAFQALELGLGNHPDYVPAHIVRGRCSLDILDDAQAEQSFTTVLGLDAENVIALKGLAEIQDRMGRTDEARATLTRLLEFDPSNEEARARLEDLQDPPQTAAAASPPSDSVSPVADASGDPDPVEDDLTIELPEDPAGGILEADEVSDLQTFRPIDLGASGSSEYALPSDADTLVPREEKASPFGLPEDDRDDSADQQRDGLGPDLSVDPDPMPLKAEEDQVASILDRPPLAEDDALEALALDDDLLVQPTQAMDDGFEESVERDMPSLVEESSPVEPDVVESLVEASPPADPELATPFEESALSPDEPSEEATDDPVAFEADQAAGSPDSAEDEGELEIVGSEDQAYPGEEDGEAELVVTETMAELFLRQGHEELALAVYTQLARRAPDDVRLQEAIERLTPESAPAEAAAEPARAYAAAETGGESVGAFLRAVLGARERMMPAPVVPPAIEPGRPGGEPTRPSGDSFSLTSVFGDEGAPGPAGTPIRPEPDGADELRGEGEGAPSYDEFFGAASGGAGTQAPERQGRTDPDDLVQFNEWLKGLKR